MCPDAPDPSDNVRQDSAEALDADEALSPIQEGSHEDDAASVGDIQSYNSCAVRLTFCSV